MHIGTPFSICSRVRIITDEQNKRHLIFRHHETLSPLQHGRPVPYVASPPDLPPEVPPDRYYFCNNYFIPLTMFVRYLENTKDMSDEEVWEENSKARDHMLDDEGRVLAYKIQSWGAGRNLATPYPGKFISTTLDRCIKKLHLMGDSDRDIADLLGVGVPRVVRAVLGEASTPKKKAKSEVGPKGSRSILVPDELKKAPEYGAIKKAANYARIRAAKMGVQSTFLLGDVVPTLYDVQGNSGRHNSELVVPRVCPVLRIKLAYNVFEDNKGRNTVRVWRKTPGPDGMAPLSYDNVIVMSALAAWAIEGAYAKQKLSYLDDTARNALAEWQAKYGTRTVPREAKIGRPSKKS